MPENAKGHEGLGATGALHCCVNWDNYCRELLTLSCQVEDTHLQRLGGSTLKCISLRNVDVFKNV